MMLKSRANRTDKFRRKTHMSSLCSKSEHHSRDSATVNPRIGNEFDLAVELVNKRGAESGDDFTDILREPKKRVIFVRPT